MSSRCKECGHPTQFSRDIGSAVCTHCGTLADSSQQSALTTASDFLPDTYSHDLHTSTRPTTLKSIRRNAAWDLPGQAARNERNKFIIYESIRALAERLGHRGAAIRAKAIFDSVMQRPSVKVKWGRAAKLAAGAALVFAIREQDRGDHTHHVAYLLSETVVELKRTQLRLLPHLALDLPRNRATSHLPSLAAHLSALASVPVPTLPKDTLAFIRPLLSPVVVQDVLRTTSALYDLPNLERSAFNAGGAGAGGCALLLLALEAHARPPRPMPHVLVLASQLGAALGARGAAVMARYRVLVSTIEAGAARVPWLANAKTPGSKHIARRSRVASAVLDVLQFREEVGRAEIAEGGGPIHVDLEAEDDGDDGEEGDRVRDEAELDALLTEVEQTATKNTRVMSHEPQGSCTIARTTAAPERKFKKRRTATTQAASFLLDPLGDIAPARPALAHTSYLLSSDADIRSDTPPTRLQLLAAERGDTDAVRDDELFGEDELEGIVIGTDEKARGEREKRAQAMWMIWGEDVANSTRDDVGPESTGKRKHPGQPGYTKKGRERVDMDKLAALLDSDDPSVALGVEGFCSGDDDKEGGECGRVCIGGGGGEEVEGEWRPASPGGLGFEAEWPGEW